MLVLLIFTFGCQQVVKQEVMQEPKAEPIQPVVETTGEQAVDTIGNDLNTINSVDEDLDADELSDLDSGLADI